MFVIICAMSEERDALLSLMNDIKKEVGNRLAEIRKSKNKYKITSKILTLKNVFIQKSALMNDVVKIPTFIKLNIWFPFTKNQRQK